MLQSPEGDPEANHSDRVDRKRVVESSTVGSDKPVGNRSEVETVVELNNLSGPPAPEKIKTSVEKNDVDSENLSEAVAGSLMTEIVAQEKARYTQVAQEMTFNQYLEKVLDRPELFIRNVAKYTTDAMESYGTKEREILGQEIVDFKLKDWPWQSAEIEDKVCLVGQEIPTHEFYKTCQLFAAQDHPSRMIIMHGPPGSGKTLFGETMDALLEDYSRNNPEGALYRLTWVFGDKPVGEGGLGFGAWMDASKETDASTGKQRYIIRPDGNTDPIFLLSKEAPVGMDNSPREELYKRLTKSGKLPEDFNRNYLLMGELDSTSERILDALLNHYKGDMEKVLGHARIERWTYSAKIGRGLASIRPNPDRSADAEPLYHSAGSSYQMPPTEISSVGGELRSVKGITLNANRGQLHFADLMRPNERDRSADDLSRLSYLLETIEGGTAQILSMRDPSSMRTERINTIIRADTNDEHIMQKRQGSAWKSFRQRCSFITVGITTRYKEEAKAHYHELHNLLGSREIDPHALDTFALFVTATRLLKPRPQEYVKIHEDLPAIIGNMSVTEKALLLQEPKKGRVRESLNILKDNGKRLKTSQLSLLTEHVHEVAEEFLDGVGNTRFSLYDGGHGISTRAAQDLLKEMVLYHSDRPFTVQDVMEVLEETLEGGFEYYQEIGSHKARYIEQIQQAREEEKQAGKKKLNKKTPKNLVEEMFPIPDPDNIVADVKKFAQRKVEDDVYQALGVVGKEESSYYLLRYLDHVKASMDRGDSIVRQEYRATNEPGKTGPDETVMRDFEDQIIDEEDLSTDEDRLAYRKGLISHIGQWSIDNPGESVEEHLDEIFHRIISGLRDFQKAKLNEAVEEFVVRTRKYTLDESEYRLDLSGDSNKRKQATEWKDAMEKLENLGYPADSIARLVVWAVGLKSENLD